ncbi:MAG: outer membrane beta-barrel protein [Bacteroidia bacterium]|nr:outer membrane beta-barrel protein [Bacteroidia bacterium]
MYKLYLIVCYLMFELQIVAAQNFSGGLVLGINASQIDGDNFKGYHKRGGTLGGYVNYRFSKTFSVQPEILFEQLGSRSRDDRFTVLGGTAVDLKINSLNIPLILMFRHPIVMGDNTELDVDWCLGASLGVRTNWRDVHGNSPEINFLRRYDSRLIAGLDIPLGTYLIINGRITYSLLPTLDEELPIPGQIMEEQSGRLRWYYRYLSLSLRINLIRADRWKYI